MGVGAPDITSDICVFGRNAFLVVIVVVIVIVIVFSYLDRLLGSRLAGLADESMLDWRLYDLGGLISLLVGGGSLQKPAASKTGSSSLTRPGIEPSSILY